MEKYIISESTNANGICEVRIYNSDVKKGLDCGEYYSNTKPEESSEEYILIDLT